MINFCVKNFSWERPLTALALIVHANFVRLIFIAAVDYENIFTMKISRFTVHVDLYTACNSDVQI